MKNNMITRKRIFVGDLVETNENFKPKNKQGEPVEIGDETFRGIIVSTRGEYYGVKFKPGLEFTNYLDGLLGSPTGCLLHKNEFNLKQ